MLVLKPADTSFAFQPGQWVDFSPAGLRSMGGYSICSTPGRLQAEGVFELAVKRSSQATAAWIHDTAQCGDTVVAAVGGSFCLLEEHLACPLLLLAGGIGVTPLCAMLGHAAKAAAAAAAQEAAAAGGEAAQEDSPPGSPAAPRIVILYSAKSREDLVLLPQILHYQLLAPPGHIVVRLHITEPQPSVPQAGEGGCSDGSGGGGASGDASDGAAAQGASAPAAGPVDGGGGPPAPPRSRLGEPQRSLVEGSSCPSSDAAYGIPSPQLARTPLRAPAAGSAGINAAGGVSLHALRAGLCRPSGAAAQQAGGGGGGTWGGTPPSSSPNSFMLSPQSCASLDQCGTAAALEASSACACGVRMARMGAADVGEAVQLLGGPGRLHAFACGPAGMVDWAEAELGRVGVCADRVHVERWW